MKDRRSPGPSPLLFVTNQCAGATELDCFSHGRSCRRRIWIRRQKKIIDVASLFEQVVATRAQSANDEHRLDLFAVLLPDEHQSADCSLFLGIAADDDNVACRQI